MSFKACYFILLLSLLSGCANNKVWVNPSKNLEESQRDFRECEYDSSKGSFVPYGEGRSPISAGIQEGFQSVSLMSNCMKSRGYILANKNELEQNKLEKQLVIDEFKMAMSSKDYSKALHIISNVIIIEPKNSSLYVTRGDIYFGLGKLKEAISDYNKATQLKDTSINLVLSKATYFVEIGEFDIALEVINQAMPNHELGPLYNIRAYTYNKKGEYEKAIADANKSIAFDGSKPNPFKNKGMAYAGLMQNDQALAEFAKAIAINPEYAETYYERSKLYSNDKDKYLKDISLACKYGKISACDLISTFKN